MSWGTRLIRRLFPGSQATEPEIRDIAHQPFVREKLKSLERRLHYRIRHREIFVHAFLHRSFPQRTAHSDASNERLEFLGDSVLNLIVGEYLFRHHPGAHEGDLTKMRSRLVNRKALATYARTLHLSEYILMSPSAAQSIGKGYETIVADTFEALVAALYLDGGFNAAQRFVERQILTATGNGAVITADDNYKSLLLERAQSGGLGVPRYILVHEEGPDHDRTFTVDVLLRNVKHGSGSGKNKKEAEQAAARQALSRIPGSELP